MATLNGLLNRKEYTPGEDLLGIAKEGVGFLSAAKNFGDQLSLDRASNKLIGIAQQRGGELSSLSFNDVSDIYDMQALGNLQQKQNENEEYRLKGMQSRYQADLEHYNQVIYPRMSLIQRTYQNGDLDGFAQNVEQLNNALGTPYRLKRNSDGTGFNMFFRKNGQGFVDTGRQLSNEEVLKMANDLGAGTQFVVNGVNGEKIAVNPHYNMWAERQRMNTMQGNIRSAMNPSLMLGPDGRQYRAVFQNRWNDYNADGDVVLFDAKSGQKIGVFGASELGNNGFYVPQMGDGSKGSVPMAIQTQLLTGGAINPQLIQAQNTVAARSLLGGAGGGRGGRRGGGGVAGVNGGVPTPAMPQGWRNLPPEAVAQINALTKYIDEDRNIKSDKLLNETARLVCMQTRMSPKHAIQLIQELAKKTPGGLATLYNAAKNGAFMKATNGQQRGTAQGTNIQSVSATPSTSSIPSTTTLPNNQDQIVQAAQPPKGERPSILDRIFGRSEAERKAEQIKNSVTQQFNDAKKNGYTRDFPQWFSENKDNLSEYQQAGARILMNEQEKAKKEQENKVRNLKNYEEFERQRAKIEAQKEDEAVRKALNMNQFSPQDDTVLVEGGGNLNDLLARGAGLYRRVTGENPMFVASEGEIPGLLEAGNIDIANRPVVQNPDGSISTVRSMSVGMNIGGKDVQVLIPTVAEDGSRILSPEEAIVQFRKTGHHLGIFDNSKNATDYSINLHNQQAKMYTR